MSDPSIDPRNPSGWPFKLRRFAWEAMDNQRLHKARAARLVGAGLAVYMSDGRCVVKLSAQDALRRMFLKGRRDE